MTRAARATAAVSTRRIRRPRSTGCHPRAMANATSSAVNPPSGPMASAALSLGIGQGRGVCPGCATSRQATVSLSMRNSGHALGSEIAINRFRPHCLDASITTRCNRFRALSTGWAAPRSVSSGTSRDAQLDHLLDEPLLPIALGQRHAQDHGDRRLAVNFAAAGNGQLDFATTRALDNGIEFPARAVEERDAHPHLGPHHVQKMMGLGAGQDGPVRDHR